MYMYRVLKQAMRASGGNLTDSHIEELSLCALFLMSAAKKVDKEFSCHQSSVHTVREAKKDIDNMAQQLLEKSATSFLTGRTGPIFEDPTEKGLKKLCNTEWVHEILAKSTSDEEVEEEERYTDLDYDISDVI